jgi:zinc ribbon protein
MVLVGIRDIKPKIVAYRNDYCISCDSPQRAHRIRRLKVLHLFFIPVFPLALVRRWRCSVCDRHPHWRAPSRQRWLVTYLLAMFTATAWISSDTETGNSVLGMWLLRIGVSIAFVLVFSYALRGQYDFQLKEKLGTVEAAQETNCPFCGTQFIQNQGWRCPQCGVEKAALNL